VRLEAEATATALRVRVGGFKQGQADEPGVRRVLARLVDEVREERDGDGAVVELVVSTTKRAGT
jgi:hypothetical protein